MSSWTASDNIVILGAGIIGLDVALVLASKGLGKNITVVAEYLPGDTAPSYTSPWAGCNYSAISGSDPKALRWDQHGYAHLFKLATDKPDAAFVKKTPSVEIWNSAVPDDKIETMSEYLSGFRVLPADQLPPGAAFGIAFTTVTVNAPRHLLWLFNTLQAAGVTFIRQRLPDIQSAFASSTTKLVFNCIGNSAKTFPGINDTACYPTRGQVLLVKAPNVTTNMMRYADNDSLTYIIPRPGTKGHVILGGYYQKGNGDYATYALETESILARTRDLSQQLRSEKNFELLAVVSGLRPSREGGARVERDVLVVNGVQKVLVHNYGAGGTGYQAGYGMALDAVATIEDMLPRKSVASL